MNKGMKTIIREELLERLSLELIGPNEPHEILNERPGQRYLTGILWPNGTNLAPEDDERQETEENREETGQAELGAPLMQAMKPSSIGISFIVEGNCTELEATAKWGAYSPTGKKQWAREPVEFSFSLPLLPADGKRRKIEYTLNREISLEWVVRPLEKRYAVSLFLVNRRINTESVENDELCLFQPSIMVEGKEGSRPFSVRKMESSHTLSQEALSDELLYRNQTVFATGHGISVTWKGLSENRLLAQKLETVTMPFYEVPKVIPPKWTLGGSLDMKKISNARSGSEIYDYLSPLDAAYSKWISDQEKIRDKLDGDLYETAEEHLRECRRSLDRIRNGFRIISSPDYLDVFKAFQFANRVMAMQRTQSLYAREAIRTKDWSKPAKDVPTVWRPFQIAFILQSLEGIVCPGHEERGTADLLWFPTGGGKTEAYLGLAAFILALRRLRGEQDGMRGDTGVSVIMRYTLRLLTIQQFQRASTLICACEVLRRKDPDTWGKVPFRIGLWVGTKNTPNNFDDCAEVLPPNRKAAQSKSTPVQLLSCPWCGSPISERNYLVDRSNRRILISCSRKECEFRINRNPEGGIPALMYDEEIYRLLPSMIIGTVDKFARMPWVGETQTLTGHVKGELESWGFYAEGSSEKTKAYIENVTCGVKKLKDNRKILPPELIIQDELHLISGPLGTMVGLYESALDWLCSRKINGVDVGPKVIASTATIRRAKEQVGSLFRRDLTIFPSPGIDAGNSFFSVEQSVETTPGRMYAGIYAPGRSVKTAQVRVYAALLAATGAMKYDSSEKDPYETVVGYFNSLRELGGAVRLIEDDVKARMRVLSNRKSGQKFAFVEKIIRDIPELTSREETSKIPGILQRLEKSFTANIDDKVYPVEIVLASNMISVGVDVSRLGLMVVTGQPKTTAEYIQATSRVGREYPGLVITVYNWSRPRDTSHYEQFTGYHSALYRYVEAISVTPFSSRARDRALAATIITMIRHKVENMAQRESAGKFSLEHKEIQQILNYLLKRVGDIDPSKQLEVEQHVRFILERWQQAATSSSANMVYDGGKDRQPLMFSLGDKNNGVFGVPNSMRDVEKTVGIYLKKR